VASVPEERAAFDQLVARLHGAAAASARALRRHRGTPAGRALDRQLEHTLDRLALLYGRGTYENLSTEEIFALALTYERRLAADLDEQAAAAATARVRSLVGAARRGVRLHVREPPSSVRIYRGVYVAPLRPEFERSLWQRREPYLRWRDGVVAVLHEDEVAALRAGGEEADVLFLDPDELLDLDARGDRRALETELDRRLTAARAAPDQVGDSRDGYLLRLLHAQSIVLRNLRERLAGEHPAAHAALLPLLAEHRGLLEERLAGEPVPSAARDDPLGASIDHERELHALAGRWAAEPDDPAGLRGRFRAVADAGTRLAELKRHMPPQGPLDANT
jgi:hypothetical protein